MIDRTRDHRRVPVSENRALPSLTQATLAGVAESQMRLLAKLAEVVAAELRTGRKDLSRRSRP